MNILQFGPAISSGLEARKQSVELFLKWSASERGPVEFFNYFAVWLVRSEQTGHPVFLFAKQFREGGPADHLKCLRHVAFAGSFRIRCHKPKRFAEHLEKLVGSILAALAFAFRTNPRQLGGSQSRWITAKF